MIYLSFSRYTYTENLALTFYYSILLFLSPV